MKIKNFFHSKKSKSEKLRLFIIEKKIGRVKKLLNSDPKLVANVYNEWDNITPLNIVAAVGDVSMTNLFLEKGANVNAKGTDNITPLIKAAIKNNIDVAQILIKNGADVNASHHKEEGKNYLGLAAGTPLHWAAQSGNSSMAELLISNGANIDPKCADGKTPLQYSLLSSARYNVARILIENGADIFIKDTEGKNLLHIIANHLYTLLGKGNTDFTESFLSDERMAKLLIEKGIEINALDNKLCTPLILACSKPFVNVELVKLLLDKNADAKLKDVSGKTALQYAYNVKEQISSKLPEKYLISLNQVIDLLS